MKFSKKWSMKDQPNANPLVERDLKRKRTEEGEAEKFVGPLHKVLRLRGGASESGDVSELDVFFREPAPNTNIPDILRGLARGEYGGVDLTSHVGMIRFQKIFADKMDVSRAVFDTVNSARSAFLSKDTAVRILRYVVDACRTKQSTGSVVCLPKTTWTTLRKDIPSGSLNCQRLRRCSLRVCML